MIPVTLDTETYPIRPARMAPRVVCVQVTDPVNGPRILAGEAARAELRTILGTPAQLVIAHNTAFDALATIATWPDLLPLWLDAYATDRVTDTALRERLIRIAQGTSAVYQRNDLKTVTERYKIPHEWHEDKTGAGPRTQFHTVAHLDPAEYPPDFRRYALADLVAGEVWAAQETLARDRHWLGDEFRQARGAFFLAYTSALGMRVDPRAVDALGRRTEAEHAAGRETLTAAGLVRANGTKDTKAAAARMVGACQSAGLPIPRTATGKEKIAATPGLVLGDLEYVALDADACAVTLDPVLIAYARHTSITTLRGRVDRLRLAAATGLPVQARFDPLKETGRTSASMGDATPGVPLTSIGDQVHNLPREPGLRECYVARPGHLIVSVDWKAAELHGLAQSCTDLGLDSQLGRVLVSGRDVHLWFACQVNGWSYAWAEDALRGAHGDAARKAVKAARQGAKACMFGFPGGLGIEKFRAYARKTYGVVLSDAEARERKGLWLAAFPEMGPYLAHASAIVERGDILVHFRSWRYRKTDRYTATANSYFQGRIADMLKDAGWRITVACLDPRAGSVLYGQARPWNQAHDEILAEVSEETAHETAQEITRIMEAVGAEWCPSCPVKAEPALQRRWRKGAEPAHDPISGRLIPWEDRVLGQETIEKIQKDLARGIEPIYISWAYGIEETMLIRLTPKGGPE